MWLYLANYKGLVQFFDMNENELVKLEIIIRTLYYEVVVAHSPFKYSINYFIIVYLTLFQRQGVFKEVNIMRRVKHKNVVNLFDFVETEDFYHLVMELAEGGELFHQIVNFTYFSENLARHIIIQVAEAVKHLHDVCGIVHRDIKPENLLFQPIEYLPSQNYTPPSLEPNKLDEGMFLEGIGAGGIGRILIADFGFSKVVWNSKTATPCGTVGYAAPEIVNDELYSKNVDMWAMGCVLHTMLCGFPPFFDENIKDLASKVVNGEFEFLSPWWDDISDSAKDLITHLLTVDPRERYDIHQFFQHPWIKGESKMPENFTYKPKLHGTPGGPKLSLPRSLVSKGEIDIPTTPIKSATHPLLSSYSEPKTPGVSSVHEAMGVAYDIRRLNHLGFSPEQLSKKSMNTGSIKELILDEETTTDDDDYIISSFPLNDTLGSEGKDPFSLNLKESSLYSRRSAKRVN